MINPLFSLGLGIIIGTINGLSLYAFKWKALSISEEHTTKSIALIVLSCFIRISLFCILFYYLLIQHLINPILFVLTFFGSFWCTLGIQWYARIRRFI